MSDNPLYQMKVLHLPLNIASQMSVTVRALRDIGVEARGLAHHNSVLCDATAIEDYQVVSRKQHPIRGVIKTAIWWRAVERAIRWADVIHWHFRTSTVPFGLDLKYCAWLDKARLVEFWGSDIRIPQIVCANNPYALQMYQRSKSHPQESLKHSIKVQARFARHGFECLIPGDELPIFVQDNIFPEPFRTRQRVMTSDYQPRYPDPNNQRPLVVHTPSHRGKKGTESVLAAVAALKDSYDFDFQLIENVPHVEALKMVSQCDIMLDQFVLSGYGLAASEAMALGKPTFCYIAPTHVCHYPSDLPIIIANQDNLKTVLGELLANGQRRMEIGQRSRAFVEKFHDAHKLARELVAIYEKLLSPPPSRRARTNR